jgi:uncharacterized membrane protein required for colicin V production
MTMSIHPVDIAVLVYIAYGVYQGLQRGLSGELTRLITLLLAVLAAGRFFPAVGEFIAERRPDFAPATAQRIGLVGVLIGGYLLLSFGRFLARSLMEFKFREPFERLGGVLFGTARAGLISLVVILAVALWRQEVFEERLAEATVAGRVVQQWLIPLYERLAADHPDWPLPGAPGAGVGEAEPMDDDQEPPPLRYLQVEDLSR